MPLNYRRLRYFWAVARWGTLRAAAERLHVSEPTLSVQIRKLQRWLGEPLLRREGRRLVLTELGQVVYQYADEIFSIGDEMVEVARGRTESRSLPLRVGVTETIPKTLVSKILSPALDLDRFRIEIREDTTPRLVGDLATHLLDLVLSDRALGDDPAIDVHARLLVQSQVSVVASSSLREQLPGLDATGVAKAPWLLQTEGSPIRADLERWFLSEGIRPRVVAEVQDSALLKAFASAGRGLIALPSVVEDEIRARYGLETVLRIPGTEERFYALTVGRQIAHPGVRAVLHGSADAPPSRAEEDPPAPGAGSPSEHPGGTPAR